MIIGFIIFILGLGIGALLIWASVEGQKPGFAIAGVLVGILGLAGLGFIQIGPGHVGVVTSFGSVHDEELQPGLHWMMPVFNHVDEIDVRVRGLRIEGYTAASKEQQDLFLNMTLNYHIIPDRASDIVQQVGTDFEEKIVKPRLLDIPKSVTDDYATTVVLNSRDEIRTKSVELLSNALEQYGFVVDTINIENFSYSPEYNAAIEQKQIEQQKIATEQQVLEQRRIQAEQAVVKAKGEADAQIETARGQAEANRLINESITPTLVQWQAIQKLNDKVQIMLIPSDNNFLLDTRSFLNQPTESAPATP